MSKYSNGSSMGGDFQPSLNKDKLDQTVQRTLELVLKNHQDDGEPGIFANSAKRLRRISHLGPRPKQLFL